MVCLSDASKETAADSKGKGEGKRESFFIVCSLVYRRRKNEKERNVRAQDERREVAGT